MATVVKQILLKNIQWYDPTSDTWKDVSGYSPSETPTPNTTPFDFGVGGAGALVYNSAFGIAIESQYTLDINFQALTDDAETYTDLNIFGSETDQIAATVKSPFVKYTVTTVTNDGVGDTTTDGTDYYYIMLGANLATSPYVTADSTTAVSNTNQSVNIAFWFPSLTTKEPGVTQELLNKQNDLLGDQNRWRVEIKDTGNLYGATYYPYDVQLKGIPSSNSATDYGMAKQEIVLKIMGWFPSSDTYTADVYFDSNDFESWVPIADTGLSITATVTELIGTMAEPYVVSLDSDVSVQITFSQPSA
jgi:hypothetical protein